MKIKKRFSKLLQETGLFFSRAGRRIAPAAVFCLLSAFPAIAQEAASLHLQGKVVDRLGDGMPGVTVRLDQTLLGTATDKNGEFTLVLPVKEGVLSFSFIGFRTRKVPFAGAGRMRVVLEEEVSALDEVKVVAYGEQSKREMVGAISSVSADDIKEIPASSVAALLQGRVAGMDVVNMTGAPGGAGTVITIRGFNSLSQEEGRRYSNPLWVVDGVKIRSENEMTGMNQLADIDPNDIESIQVLKDASSAAIYGSEAANGVIIVTTKRGRPGQDARISLTASRTWSFQPALPHLIGGNYERQVRAEALKNQAVAYYDPEQNRYVYPRSYREAYEQGARYDFFWNQGEGSSVRPLQDSLNSFYNNSTNLFDYYFSTARVTTANLQMTGGFERAGYHIGLGYYEEQGVLRRTGFDRINLTGNLYLIPRKSIEANLRFYLARTAKQRSLKGLVNSESAETIPDLLTTTSTLLPGQGSPGFEELVRSYNLIDEKNETYRLRASFDLSWEIIEGLKLKSSVALDYGQHNQHIFKPAEIDQYDETYSMGQIVRNMRLVNENLLTWKRNRGNHRIDFLAGFSMQSDEQNRNYGYGRRAPSDEITYVPWRESAYDVSVNRALKDYISSLTRKTMASLFSRLNYNYGGRYLFSFSLRRDGSSCFGERVRWATFPSLGAGYAFSETALVKAAAPWLNYGKLRISWGHSGKQFESPYLAHGELARSSINFLGQPAVTPEWNYGLMNRELTWEDTYQWDFGLDLDLFDYRLEVGLDYYRRYTDNLLYRVRIAGDYTGYMNQWRNAYAISNSGIELKLRGDVIRKADLSWEITLNVARNWNRLRKSRNGADFKNYSNPYNHSVIGKPLNGIYVLDTYGIVQSEEEVPYQYIGGRKVYLGGSASLFYRPGDRMMRDADGTGLITVSNVEGHEDDRVYAGSPLPLAQGGLIHHLTWKRWECQLLFSYSLGRHILNAGRGASVATTGAVNTDEIARPIFADPATLTFWQQPGDRTNYPANRMADGSASFSTFIAAHVEQVNYLKLKSMTVGYTLPRSKAGISGRLYVTAENLFTWSNYTGNDPETVDILSGIDYYNNYPMARKVTLGLTIHF